MKGAFAATLLALAAAVPLMAAASPATAAGGDVIAIGGSDTTQNVIHALFGCKDVASGGLQPGQCSVPTTASNNGVGSLYNLKVPPNMVGTVTVPSDTHCNSVTYTHDTNGYTSQGSNSGGTPPAGQEWPPYGSGAGRDALFKSVNEGAYPNAATHPYDNGGGGATISPPGGCIDIGRSSGFAAASPSTTDTGLDWYAFAIDDVTWSTASLQAPASLTIQQLRDIYNCRVSDWSEVGGAPGPIQRVLPQTGSGTGDFFVNVILGQPKTGDNRNIFPNNDGAGGHVCAPIIYNATGSGSSAKPAIEENNGSALLDPAYRDNLQTYIYPYSAGLWSFQANAGGNPSLDKRGGFRLGGLQNLDGTTGNGASSIAAWPVRWVGTKFQLNDGTIIPTAPGNRTVANVTASAQLSSTVTAAHGAFTATDIGKYVQGPTINDGTLITNVTDDGTTATATLSTPTKLASLLPFGVSYPSTATVTVGWSVVSEGNPAITPNSSDIHFTGVRYVYNVIKRTGTGGQEPSYAAARSLIGFDDTSPSGVVSNLCNGNSTDAGTIRSNGFQPLPALVRSGSTNTTPVSCILFQT
jgi:ABC-type phosphate transport system substrate-binding protein